MKCRTLLLSVCLTLTLAPALAERYPVAQFMQQLQASRTPGAEQGSRIVGASREVLARMAAAYGMRPPDYFIDTDIGHNAYVTYENGRPIMVVSLQMLALAGDDRDMQAAIIGHELAHLKADHLAKAQSTHLFVTILGAVVGAAVDARQARRGVHSEVGRTLGHVGAGLTLAKFSRDDERQADELGVRAMASAGFDPSAAARLWKKLSALGGGGSGLWMSSHPSHGEREQTLTSLAMTVARAAPPAVLAHAESEPALEPDPFPASTVALAPSLDEARSGSDYVRGTKALAQKRYRDALRDLKAAAAAGDERAMHVLGALYSEAPPESGVLVDHQQAKGWFDRAVAKGFVPAMGALGMLKLSRANDYFGGYDALRLLRWASQRGDSTAPAALAFAYLEGSVGIARDESLATKYAKVAMERGNAAGKAIYAAIQTARAPNPEEARASVEMLQATASEFPAAHFLIGSLHEHGLGLPKSRERAIEAYRLGAAAGVDAAKKRLTELTR